MVYSEEDIRKMIAEYVDGIEESILLSRYGMRKDKWSKVKSGSLRRLEGIDYPVRTKAEIAKREEIAGWLEGGEAMSRIAREMRIPYSEVRRIAAELKAEGLVVQKRERKVALNFSEPQDQEWDEWRYAYEEHRADWCCNQRIIEYIYNARGIPSQRLLYPIA